MPAPSWRSHVVTENGSLCKDRVMLFHYSEILGTTSCWDIQNPALSDIVNTMRNASEFVSARMDQRVYLNRKLRF
jgi:hypothetical protein